MKFLIDANLRFKLAKGLKEKRLFELLKSAYIDARYKMNEYRITKTDLEYLSTRVRALKKLTKEICLEKIEQMGAAL